MTNLKKQLEDIKQTRPELHQFIVPFTNGDIPDYEKIEFLSLSEEDKKSWLIDKANIMEASACKK